MRILTISNLYPPHFIGGYELGCRDVMQGLVQRGHQVEVLTSTWEVENDVVENDGAIKVHRCLRHFIGQPHEPKPQKLWLMSNHNRAALQQVTKQFQPDLIYCWNLAALPPRLAFDAKQTGLPLCCYVSDLWLSRWLETANENESAPSQKPLFSWLYGELKPHPKTLKFRRVHCTSTFIKAATLRHDTPENSTSYEVIHWSVETRKFSEKLKNSDDSAQPHRLIYAGQLAPHKGVATAIEAVRMLKQNGCQLMLTIAGPSTYGNHGEELRELVKKLNLQNEVTFLGPVAREKLPQLLSSQEIFVFPAVWEEPFSIGLLEAMAAGLGVVSTTTGGSREIVQHEENALAFAVGDATDCAAQIQRLLDDAALLEKVSSNARRTIQENFTMAQMIERIENSLIAALGAE